MSSTNHRRRGNKRVNRVGSGTRDRSSSITDSTDDGKGPFSTTTSDASSSTTSKSRATSMSLPKSGHNIGHTALSTRKISLRLGESARSGRLEDVLTLLSQGASPREAGDVLASALANNHPAVACELIAAGADPNHVYARDLGAPLARAAENGLKEPVKLLLKAGARVDWRDPHGLTPLHMAALNGHLSVCKLLLSHGASPTAKDDDGQYAFELVPDFIPEYVDSSFRLGSLRRVTSNESCASDDEFGGRSSSQGDETEDDRNEMMDSSERKAEDVSKEDGRKPGSNGEPRDYAADAAGDEANGQYAVLQSQIVCRRLRILLQNASSSARGDGGGGKLLNRGSSRRSRKSSADSGGVGTGAGLKRDGAVDSKGNQIQKEHQDTVLIRRSSSRKSKKRGRKNKR